MKELKKLTKNELFNTVSKFYTGALDINKALKLYEFEYGDQVEIKENDEVVSQSWIDAQNYPWFINSESLTFMYDLQQSGTVNMMTCLPNIVNSLRIDRKDAQELLKTYMTDYTKIYNPELLV